MQIHTYTRIGTHDTDHNEDAYVTAEIGTDRLLLAVLDGCSTGTDSHLVAGLAAKLLRKIAQEYFYQEFAQRRQLPLPELLNAVVESLFAQLKQTQSLLQLSTDELLSTLVLAVVDQPSHRAETLVVGDGLVGFNGTFTEYEQGEEPEFLGYHLTGEAAELSVTSTYRRSLADVYDLSLATDGVFTFRPFNHDSYPPKSEAAIIDFLLTDSTGKEDPNMLKKKIKHVERLWGLRATDDLTLVRLIWDGTEGLPN